MSARPPEPVVWHDVECGSYTADLPLWLSLAERAGGPVLDVGAGTGRVALALARAGYDVTALDSDRELLGALSRRAPGLAVETVVADARDFRLERRFALCLVAMQTIQLLGGPQGRGAFLRAALDHLRPGGLMAAAIAEDLAAFEPGDPAALPPPDIGQHDGWVYASQPLALRHEPGAMVMERRRELVSPDGTRTARADVVRLDRVTSSELARDAQAAGFTILAPVDIPPTAEHVGSRVVIARA